MTIEMFFYRPLRYSLILIDDLRQQNKTRKQNAKRDDTKNNPRDYQQHCMEGM
jgi:hypothetical protein